MNHPLVSVNIITYNQQRYIRQTVEGALQQQTTFGVEIIIGEDCSTDGTREIVLEYRRKYPDRIHVITSNQNVGPHANHQRILAASRGKYVAFCDGDDYWTNPGKLQTQIEFLEANPDYCICCHDVEVIYDGVPKTGDKYVEFNKDTFSFDDAVKGHFIPTLSIVYKRDALAKVPPWFAECMSADLLIAMLLLDKGPGYYIHEKMGVKRDQPGSISRAPGRTAMVLENFLRMYKNTDVYTEGRHRDILHWMIARLSLRLAGRHLTAGRLAPFFKYTLESLRYDRRALCDAARRRLGLRRQ